MASPTYTRSVIVTGGTANLGYYAALAIAREHPDYLVVVSSRSDPEHAADAINAATGNKNAVFHPLDLADLASVRRYAADWATRNYPPIASLVFNAGLQFPGELRKTSAGLESTFAICHVGHALLFHLMFPLLASKARVVVVASGTHDPTQKTGLPDAIYTSAEDLAHPPESMINVPGRQRYSSSKLANILWTYVLDRRLRERAADSGVVVNAFDPGLMPGSGLAREASGLEKFIWTRIMPKVLPVMRALISPNIHKPEESGKRLAMLAVGSEFEGVSGKYFEGLKEIKSSVDSYDKGKQEDLWQWTVKYLSNGDAGELSRFETLK